MTVRVIGDRIEVNGVLIATLDPKAPPTLRDKLIALVAEMRRLSSTWPRWMTNASYEQAQLFRTRVKRALALTIRGSRKPERWRSECRMCIRDFAALQEAVENRFANAG